jgi:hypothetical protein
MRRLHWLLLSANKEFFLVFLFGVMLSLVGIIYAPVGVPKKYLILFLCDFFIVILSLTIPFVIRLKTASLIVFVLYAASALYEIMGHPTFFSKVFARPCGLAINPNLLSPCLLACYSGFCSEEFNYKDGVLLAIIGLLVVFSLSRGGIVLYLSVLALIFYKNIFGMHAVNRKRVFAVAIGTVTVAVCIGLIQYTMSYMKNTEGSGRLVENRINMFESGSLLKKNDIRKILVERSLTVATDSSFHFIFGNGTGSVNSPLLLKTATGPHNTYLRFFVNNGILGALAYISMLLIALWYFYTRKYWPGSLFIWIVMLSSVFSHNIPEIKIILMVLGAHLSISSMKDRTKIL